MEIHHTFDPYLIRIYGEFGIRWYSLAYILGFFLVQWYLRRSARAGEIRNLDEDGVDSYVLWALVGALVGARFFHVFVFEFRDYGFDPLAWIAVWRGGLAFHGGLTGVAVVTLVFCRRNKVSFYAIADRAVIPVAIALGFGRIANFINAEMYGTLYNGPFCVDYSANPYMRAPPQGCRHPVQLYEMAKNWFLAAVLWADAAPVATAPRCGVLEFRRAVRVHPVLSHVSASRGADLARAHTVADLLGDDGFRRCGHGRVAADAH